MPYCLWVSQMLNSRENKVMSLVYSASVNKNSLLISPTDLIKNLKIKDFTEEKLDKTVNDLALDGYFDLVYSDRRGERIYCITLSDKGRAFGRNAKVMRRNLLFRIGLSAALAVFSFIIGLILKAIF